MTGGLNFSEAFWDSDIVGIAGWDILCKRMKDGKAVCADVAHFFKDRAKAEGDYSKSLANIARKAGGKDETGRLGESWRIMKAQTEKMAGVHEDAANRFNNLAEELTRFLDEQKRVKQQSEDLLKKYIQSKRNEYNKTMQLKKSYEGKCVEYNNAEENLKTALAAVTVKRSDQEKATQKRDKCLEASKNADTAYKSAIESLESVRQRWEDEMEKTCKRFEDLEKNRIDFLRDALWKCTNVDSQACVDHDECCETVRGVLEHCDVMEDLQEFVRHNMTGSMRPKPVLYENYYNGKGSVPNSRPQPPQVSTMGRRPPQPVPQRPQDLPYDDGLYATVDMNVRKSKTFLRVLRDFSARVLYNKLIIF